MSPTETVNHIHAHLEKYLQLCAVGTLDPATDQVLVASMIQDAGEIKIHHAGMADPDHMASFLLALANEWGVTDRLVVHLTRQRH